MAVLSESCRYRLEPCAALFAEWQSEEPDSPELRNLLGEAGRSRDHQTIMAPALRQTLALLFGGPDASATPVSYEVADEASQVYRLYYHHGAPFPEDATLRLWQACAEDPRCRERAASD